MPTNTGEQEKEQRDTNPSSPTYNQVRWVTAGTNTADCPVSNQLYSSYAITQTVYRNDCGTGTSTGIPYTVPAGHIVSATSQADADTQALAYFNNSKQGYAQQNATCIAPGVRNCQLNSDGCFTGYMVDGAGNTLAATPSECQSCFVAQGNAPGVYCAGTAC